MLTALVVLILATLIGYPILRLFDRNGDFLLAPTVGLGSVIAFGYLVSANTGLTGGQSVAIALAVTGVLALVSLLRPTWRENLLAGLTVQTGFQTIAGVVVALVMLFPALGYGIEKFYGVVNYDFFYNSLDALFLASHPVTEFVEPYAPILPLGGGADAQGRFAIGLAGAFASAFFGQNTVHFNTGLISALLVINTFAFIAFSNYVFRTRSLASTVAGGAIALSAGFAQSYIYFLLGQISALPILVFGLIYLAKYVDGISERSGFISALILAAIVNVLYIFYAILAVYLVAFIVFALGLSFLFTGGRDRLAVLKALGYLALASAIIFVLARLTAIGPTVETIQKWISLSFQTAVDVSSRPKILGDYVVETFFPLLLGITSYPVALAVLPKFLPAPQVSVLVGLGFAALLVVLASSYQFVRARGWSGTAVVLLSVILVTLASACVFFLTESGYSVFKLATWFVPLFVPIVLFALTCWIRKLVSAPLAMAAALYIGASLVTGLSYIFVFVVPSMADTVSNSSGVNGLQGIAELKTELARNGATSVVLDLKSGLRMAWVANELGATDVTALTHNFQPLTDRELPATICESRPSPVDNAIVVYLSRDNDIISQPRIGPVLFDGGEYSGMKMADVSQYAFLGRGTYLPEQISASQAELSKLPTRFRWVEKGAEVFLYSRVAGRANFTLDAYPGYVKAPTSRTLVLTGQNIETTATFSAEQPQIEFDDLPVKAGMNCFYVSSPDVVSNVPRLNALVRPNTLSDFRLLNFALSNLRFDLREVMQ